MNDDKLVKKKFCQSTTEKGWRRKDRKTKATAKLFALHPKATKTTQFFQNTMLYSESNKQTVYENQVENKHFL